MNTYKKAMAFGGMGDFILDGYLMADLEAYENDVVEREKLMMLNRTKKTWSNTVLEKARGHGTGSISKGVVLGMRWVLIPSHGGKPEIVNTDTGNQSPWRNKDGKFMSNCILLL